LHDNFAQVEKIAGRVGLFGAIAIVVVVVAAIVIVRLRGARRSQSTSKKSDEKVEPTSKKRF
jgi:hypothetical protein